MMIRVAARAATDVAITGARARSAGFMMHAVDMASVTAHTMYAQVAHHRARRMSFRDCTYTRSARYAFCSATLISSARI